MRKTKTAVFGGRVGGWADIRANIRFGDLCSIMLLLFKTMIVIGISCLDRKC